MRKDLVFIISGGRTGTQFLGERLQDVIEDCFSVHEPDTLFSADKNPWSQIRQFGVWHMCLGRVLGATGIRVLGEQLLTGAISPDRAYARLRRWRHRYHERIAAALIVESNNQWWPFADHLRRVWPNARVLGVVRDPRTWIRSWMNRGGRYDHRDWVDRLPRGRLSPARLGQTGWAERWAELGTFGKLAWEWRTVYAHLSRACASSPECRMLRFEDLFGADRLALRDLVHWAATTAHRTYRVREDRLGDFGSVVRNASRGTVPDWRHWTSAEAQLVDELCGPLMRQYGYGQEPEWRQKLRAG